jgi:hypothetical protein
MYSLTTLPSFLIATAYWSTFVYGMVHLMRDLASMPLLLLLVDQRRNRTWQDASLPWMRSSLAGFLHYHSLGLCLG